MDKLAEKYADTMRDSIAEVWEAYEEDAEVEGQPASEYLDEWPLEIVNRRGASFAVVLTLGGPDARIECDLDTDGDRWGDAVLVVSWGGDVSRRYSSHINAMADYFAELVKY